MRHLNRFQMWKSLALGLFATSISILALRFPLGYGPSLTQLLSPATGLWGNQVDLQDHVSALKNALKSESFKSIHSQSQAGGQPEIQLNVDVHLVATLTSEEEASLYFAQGYWVATHRLWQMEFLSRVASGRVAEIVGARALPIDRFMRKLELKRAAIRSFELMSHDPETRVALDAYAAGVNARIDDVRSRRAPLPTEYVLLGLEPSDWESVNSALMQKFMSWYLSGRLDDLRFVESLQKLGPTGVMDLFPLEVTEPGTILGRDPRSKVARQPNSATGPSAFQISKLSNLGIAASVKAELGLVDSAQSFMLEADRSSGSNNWVVPGTKSENSSPIISNDLHLSYTIPALWIPVRLHLTKGPQAHRVFGAALVGAPGIIVGHNDDLAWAVTNGTDDVLDFYRLRFRDEKRTEYIFDDEWRPLISREERLLVRGGLPEILMLRETHLGPLWIDNHQDGPSAKIPEGVVMRWIGHEASNELKVFLRLNRGRNVLACPDAFEHYVSPAQNFICADRAGRVGYWKAGLFPKRPPERPLGDHPIRGVHEVSSSAEVWQGWRDRRENPSRYPIHDFFSTANQPPYGGRSVSDFGWSYAPSFRNLRIQELLRSRRTWSAEQIVEMQSDDQHWLGHRQKGVLAQFAQQACPKDLAEEVEVWDGHYRMDTRAASVHDLWWSELQTSLWKDRIGDRGNSLWPSAWRMLQLIESEPSSPWWDDPTTSEVETFEVRGLQTMRKICENADEIQKWNESRPTRLQHVSRLPGFGKKVARAPGAEDTIFANRGDHGPSWKMVVSFPQGQPRTWFTYPGGVSGDPASRYYDHYISTWSGGRLTPVDEAGHP
jgi:penicillin amidase